MNIMSEKLVDTYARLEDRLGRFERELQNDSKAENQRWCVGLIRDVLNYNDVVNMGDDVLKAIQEAVDLVISRGNSLTREEYGSVCRNFLRLKLAIIPTAKKVISQENIK